MDSIARACWHITKCSQKFWNERCRPHGIGIGQVPLLSLLFRKEGLSQEEISGYLSIDKAATAKALQKLLALHLVVREADAADARIKRVGLTPKGRSYRPILELVEQEWETVLVAGLTPDQADSARLALGRIRRNAILASK